VRTASVVVKSRDERPVMGERRSPPEATFLAAGFGLTRRAGAGLDGVEVR
jgi:hypothetical protein